MSVYASKFRQYPLKENKNMDFSISLCTHMTYKNDSKETPSWKGVQVLQSGQLYLVYTNITTIHHLFRFWQFLRTKNTDTNRIYRHKQISDQSLMELTSVGMSTITEDKATNRSNKWWSHHKHRHIQKKRNVISFIDRLRKHSSPLIWTINTNRIFYAFRSCWRSPPR